jgi:hypothetical protein
MNLMEDIQMKFILISMMLANPITYADKATCLTAVDALKQIEAEAVCIPAPLAEQDASDKMVTHMRKMIKRLEQMKIDLSKQGGFQGGGTTADALK